MLIRLQHAPARLAQPLAHVRHASTRQVRSDSGSIQKKKTATAKKIHELGIWNKRVAKAPTKKKPSPDDVVSKLDRTRINIVNEQLCSKSATPKQKQD